MSPREERENPPNQLDLIEKKMRVHEKEMEII